MMKVSELIEELKKYPGNYEVTTHDYEPIILVYDGDREADHISVGD